MNFNASKYELSLMERIADRACALAERIGVEYKYQTALMDINACHSNGCELKLDERLTAGDSDFAHDIFGIRRYMNRETGALTGCFCPRYALPDRSSSTH